MKRLRMPEYAEAMQVAQETFDAEMTGRGVGAAAPRSVRTAELPSRPPPPP